MKTLKNKIVGFLMILFGVIVMSISKDGTALLFLLMLGIPMIFAKEDQFTAGFSYAYQKKGDNKRSVLYSNTLNQ